MKQNPPMQFVKINFYIHSQFEHTGDNKLPRQSQNTTKTIDVLVSVLNKQVLRRHILSIGHSSIVGQVGFIGFTVIITRIVMIFDPFVLAFL